jgi:mRNA-degrading endonuclease toxin of MazEF toxin-antitoxin module
MRPWDIYTWNFPEAGPHPAVILGTDERVKNKPKVNVLLCSSQRAKRTAELHEVILDSADGMEWATICKCDLLYAVPQDQLKQKRGSVGTRRRREIAARVIRALGLAGL